MNRSIKEPSRCWECRWTRHRQCLQRTLTTLCANVHTLKGSWRRDCFMKQVEGNGRCVETPSGRGKLPYFFNRSNCLVSTLPWIDLFSDSHRGLRIELPPLRLSEAGKCRRGDIAACRWLVWPTRRPIQLNIFKRPELFLDVVVGRSSKFKTRLSHQSRDRKSCKWNTVVSSDDGGVKVTQACHEVCHEFPRCCVQTWKMQHERRGPGSAVGGFKHLCLSLHEHRAPQTPLCKNVLLLSLNRFLC